MSEMKVQPKVFVYSWWLCVAMAFALCGCRSTQPSAVTQEPAAPSPAPVLAPMPAYPEERGGWDTNAVLVFFEGPADHEAHVQFTDDIKKALRQRGYRVVDDMQSNRVRQPPYVDTDWLAAEWRRQAKLLIITATRSWASKAFEGKVSSDYCVQIMVVDHPYDGFSLSLAVSRIRTFHVWSRASLPQGATWKDSYPVHGPLLAENLMRMPGFRAALEKTPSALAASLCPKPTVTAALAVPAATKAAPGSAASGADDSAGAARLIGTWEEHVVSRVKTIGGGRESDAAVSEVSSKTVYRADGHFSRETRMGGASATTSEGVWRMRRGLLFAETSVESGGRKWTVPCEYELVWNGNDGVMFRMTQDGYQSMLRAGGGDALGRCWYQPEDVLHTTVTVGGVTVEAESKLEPAKRVRP